ncbi:glycosyltransferase [Acuticoccus sp. M5D2P5]|uniref:glycosyltransferase family 2 protein n=1 Tax=Acuticoccus kalidii TaxID=2910977 RepID=UPI001F40C7DF|nr:glycosyltransferase [Acuticoccus kalidii]MCF3932173.1 glycosyltransferase [Acuticoccus kalidii]
MRSSWGGGVFFRRKAARDPGEALRDPRQAAIVFGLRNQRPRATMPKADARLAALLDRAAPDECLNAAFVLRWGRPSEIAAAGTSSEPVRPPFRDTDYYEALAHWLGCRFDHGHTLSELVRDSRAESVFCEDGAILRFLVDGRQVVAIAPSPTWLPSLASLVSRCPKAADRIIIVPPHAIDAAVGEERPRISAGRLDPIHEIPAIALADRVVTRPQVLAFGLALAAFAVVVAVAPFVMLGLLFVTTTAILLAYAASRGLALMRPDRPRQPRRRLKASELPEYSILVPLFREGEGIAHLVRALRRLDYPPDKLDIQFLVEADDAITRRAVMRHAHDLSCRMTIVPPGSPQTKPRALNVGLRQARGSLVTIYDAEDRPELDQLRVAAETFAAAAPDMAALQARLSIDHAGDTWLTQMFAIEYACLFDHVMPMVAGEERILLLGGTSNHFRTDALIRVGGWDPYNVTEDADLAIRLRRGGYRIAMIESRTYEEAPISVDAWLKQRSRWFKGYMQTWLVHNRRPLVLLRELGWADTSLVHLFIIGALTAALAHLVFVGQLVLALTGLAPLLAGPSGALTAIQLVSVLFGYGASFALGAVSIQSRRGERISVWAVLWFPLYWILMGAAVLLALHDLIRSPHYWRKTMHGIASRPARLRARPVPLAGHPTKRAPTPTGERRSTSSDRA